MTFNPNAPVEWRQAHLNAQPDPVTGLPQLHRFQDTAAQPRKNEQPWHRMAATMLLAGCDNEQIARAANVHPATVSAIRAQRWFQELLATLANTQIQPVLGLLAAEAVASVQKLVELRDGAESERVQLAAAVSLLEHHKGKAHVTISQDIHTSKSHQDPLQEYEEIQQDLAALRQQNSIPVESEKVEPSNQ